MMAFQRYVIGRSISLSLSLLALGCSEGIPLFDSLGLDSGRSISLDNPPPSISNSTSFTFTVSSSSAVEYAYKFGLQGSTSCTDVSGYSGATSLTNSFNVSPGADGDYRLCLIGFEKAGDASSAMAPVVYNWTQDTMPPTLTIAKLNPSGTYSKDLSSIVFAVTSIEPIRVGSVDSSKLADNSSFVSGWNVTSIDAYTLHVSPLNSTEGIIQLTSSAGFIQDMAGNLSAAQSSSDWVTYDTTAPALNFASPTPTSGSSINFISITISGGCSDNLSFPSITISGDLVGSYSPTCAPPSFSEVISFSSGDGTKNVTVDLYDLAGNHSSQTLSYVWDTTVPTITSVTPPANGYYGAGSVLTFKVNFSELVNQSGSSPTIDFTINSSPRSAVYNSGSGTNQLTFTYTVAGPSDNGALAVQSALNLNGGWLKDLAGNTSALSFAPPDVSGITIDTTSPSVPTISGISPDNGTYPFDFKTNTRDITLHGSAEPNSEIEISLGDGIKWTTTSPGGTWSVSHTYSADTQFSVQVRARDQAGNWSSYSSTVTVDINSTPLVITALTAPSSSVYHLNDALSFQVTTNRDVHRIAGASNPRLELTLNGGPRFASMTNALPNTTMDFTYTVAYGDEDLDGVQIAGSLDPQGATLMDIYGNTLNLTLPTTDTTGVTVDAVPPHVVRVRSSASDGTYQFATPGNDQINIEVEFNEDIVLTGSNAQLDLDVGPMGGHATCNASSGTLLHCQYHVGADHYTPNLDYLSGSSLQLNTSNIVGSRDALDANLALPIPGDPNSLGSGANRKVIMRPSVDNQFTTGGTFWNDYVQNGSDTACSGSEPGDYFTACTHAAEKKKVEVRGVTSCDGLSIQDDLQVFDWELCDFTSGTPTFFSKGLKEGKGLRDLIESAGNNFKLNHIVITKYGDVIGSSEPIKWWSNTFQNLSSGGTFSNPSAILTIENDLNLSTTPIIIGGSNMALVTLNNAKIHQTNKTLCSSTNSMVCTSGSPQLKFLWIEVDIIDDFVVLATDATNAILLRATLQSRVHNSSVVGAASTPLGATNSAALDLRNSTFGSSKNLIRNFKAYNLPARGISLTNSNYNHFDGLKIGAFAANSSPGVPGLELSGAHDNQFQDVLISKSLNSPGKGIKLTSSSRNIIRKANISNIGNGVNGVGVELNSSPQNIFSNIVLSAIDDHGIYLSASSRNVFSHVTAANIGTNNTSSDAIVLSGSSGDNFINSLAASNSTQLIYKLTSGSLSFINTSLGYLNQGIYSGSSSHALSFEGHMGIPNEVTCVSGYNLNVGCTSSSGTLTTYRYYNSVWDSVFLASSGPTSVTDWLLDVDLFRTWGRSGTIGDDTSRGSCDGSACNLWNWQLSSSASQLLNRSGTGGSENDPFTDGQTCPSAVEGDQAITVADFYGAGTTLTFLKNAIEIPSPNGNNNGLCESGEECVYAPNIGAYQGHGGIVLNEQCTFTDGTVSGVTMRRFSQNGQ